MSAALESLFHAALAQPLDERENFVAAVEPPALRAQLAQLLAADAGAHSALKGLVDDEIARVSPDWRGRRIGAWQVLREIGSGGMGTVLLVARAEGSYQQHAALKLVRGFPSAPLLARFARERQILARLEHPNIARLIDGGQTDDGQPYTVMEYVEGVSIDRFALPLPLREKITLVRQLSSAVHYAHQRLIVHRDIKPTNVLVGADGEPKLLDFGIAKLLDDTAAGHAATLAYSPGYASPEQLQGAPISTATDIYNLGLLLHQLLTRVVRDGTTRSPPQLPSKVVTDRALVKQLHGDLDAITQRATHPEPTQRYASAQAFADDLERWLRAEPVLARPDSSWYRWRKWAQRNRLAAVIAVAAVVALSAAVGGLYRERERALVAERTALAAAERADLARASAEGVSSFMGDLFAQANAARTGGVELSARAVLDAARDKLTRDTGLSAPQRADLLGRLAAAYMSLDLQDQALALADQALKLTPADLPAALARLHYQRAQILRRQFDSAQARSENRLARALLGTPPLDVALAARIEQQMAVLLNAQGDFDGALRFLANAQRYWQASAQPDPAVRGLILNTKMLALDGLGRAEEMLVGRRELYQLSLAEAGPIDYTTLNHGINLLTTLIDHGKLDEAQTLLDALEPNARQVYLPTQDTGYARLLRERAELAKHRGEPLAALATLDAALAYDARSKGNNNQISLRVVRARVLLDLKRAPEALSDIDTAIVLAGPGQGGRAGRDADRSGLYVYRAQIQCALGDLKQMQRDLSVSRTHISALPITNPLRQRVEAEIAAVCQSP